MISNSITLFCVIFCSFFVTENKSKVPSDSSYAILRLLDNIDFPKITLRSLKVEDTWSPISAAVIFFGTVQTYLSWLKKLNWFSQMVRYYVGISIWRACYISNMEKMHILFAHPGWVGLNTYTKIINDFTQLF